LSERTEYGLLSDRSNIRFLSGQQSAVIHGRLPAQLPGDRGSGTCLKLRQSLPAAYRKHAVIYTDFRESYANIIPSECLHQVGKESSQTGVIKSVSFLEFQG